MRDLTASDGIDAADPAHTAATGVRTAPVVDVAAQVPSTSWPIRAVGRVITTGAAGGYILQRVSSTDTLPIFAAFGCAGDLVVAVAVVRAFTSAVVRMSADPAVANVAGTGTAVVRTRCGVGRVRARTRRANVVGAGQAIIGTGFTVVYVRAFVAATRIVGAEVAVVAVRILHALVGPIVVAVGITFAFAGSVVRVGARAAGTPIIGAGVAVISAGPRVVHMHTLALGADIVCARIGIITLGISRTLGARFVVGTASAARGTRIRSFAPGRCVVDPSDPLAPPAGKQLLSQVRIAPQLYRYKTDASDEAQRDLG